MDASEQKLNYILFIKDKIIEQTINDEEKIVIERCLNSNFAVQLPNFKQKISQIIAQNNLLNSLIDSTLDKIDYWVEFLIEIIFFQIKKIDFCIKSHYMFWISYKLQNNFLLLKNE